MFDVCGSPAHQHDAFIIAHIFMFKKRKHCLVFHSLPLICGGNIQLRVCVIVGI